VLQQVPVVSKLKVSLLLTLFVVLVYTPKLVAVYSRVIMAHGFLFYSLSNFVLNDAYCAGAQIQSSLFSGNGDHNDAAKTWASGIHIG
jgi:hypothetical protein